MHRLVGRTQTTSSNRTKQVPTCSALQRRTLTSHRQNKNINNNNNNNNNLKNASKNHCLQRPRFSTQNTLHTTHKFLDNNRHRHLSHFHRKVVSNKAQTFLSLQCRRFTLFPPFEKDLVVPPATELRYQRIIWRPWTRSQLVQEQENEACVIFRKHFEKGLVDSLMKRYEEKKGSFIDQKNVQNKKSRDYERERKNRHKVAIKRHYNYDTYSQTNVKEKLNELDFEFFFNFLDKEVRMAREQKGEPGHENVETMPFDVQLEMLQNNPQGMQRGAIPQIDFFMKLRPHEESKLYTKLKFDENPRYINEQALKREIEESEKEEDPEGEAQGAELFGNAASFAQSVGVKEAEGEEDEEDEEGGEQREKTEEDIPDIVEMPSDKYFSEEELQGQIMDRSDDKTRRVLMKEAVKPPSLRKMEETQIEALQQVRPGVFQEFLKSPQYRHIMNDPEGDIYADQLDQIEKLRAAISRKDPQNDADELEVEGEPEETASKEELTQKLEELLKDFKSRFGELGSTEVFEGSGESDAASEELDNGSVEELSSEDDLWDPTVAPATGKLSTHFVKMSSKHPIRYFTHYFPREQDSQHHPEIRIAYRERKVIMQVKIGELGLSPIARKRLLALLGARYHAASDTAVLICRAMPNKLMAKYYVRATFRELLTEAWRADRNFLPLKPSMERDPKDPLQLESSRWIFYRFKDRM